MILTDNEKKELLCLARESIIKRIDPQQSSRKPALPKSESLQLNCGAFISLYVDGKLRGCIGTFSEEESLWKNVKNMALSAAISDNRFKPIESGELAELKIEISVLTPRERIYDKSEIILGTHGIYMKKGQNRGTLLPQVAVNQNWTVDEFLGNCAKYKAGIGYDGWKIADLYTYEAYIFNSDEVRPDC